MWEGLQFLLKILAFSDLFTSFRFGLNTSLVPDYFATGLRCTPKALFSSDGPLTSLPKIFQVLKLKVRTPHMSPGSQAHQDVGSVVASPPHLGLGPLCPGTCLPCKTASV